MGIPERKQREREERRNLILSRARQLILRKGVHDVSMQDVADAVEISKAALYLHFEGKEALFLEIITDAMEEFYRFVLGRLSGKTDALSRLQAIGEAFLAFYRNEEELFIFAGLQEFFLPGYPLIIEDDLSSDAGKLKREFETLIRDTVELGFRDGSFDTALDPQATFRTVLFVAMSLIQKIARLPREQRDMDRLLSQMKGAFELVLRGLVHPELERQRITIPLPAGCGTGRELV